MKVTTIVEKLNILKDYLQGLDSAMRPILGVTDIMSDGVSRPLTLDERYSISEVLNMNGFYGSPAIIFDPSLLADIATSITIVLRAESGSLMDPTLTVSELLELEEGETIASKTGASYDSFIRANRTSNLLQASANVTSLRNGSSVAGVYMCIDALSTKIGTISYDSVNDVTTVTPVVSDASNAAIVKAQTIIAGVCEYRDLLLLAIKSSIADVTSKFSDFNATIQNYVDSRFASVRDLARGLRDAYSLGAFSMVHVILSRFMNQANITQNEDGSITWDESDVSSPTTNPFYYAISAAGTVGTVLGTVLIFATPVVLKVIGVLTTIAGAVVSAITSSASEAIGTAPSIDVNAPEPVYCDYITHRKVHKVWPLPYNGAYNLSSDEHHSLLFDLNPEYYNLLVDSGSLVINSTYWVIYIYNYKYYRDERNRPVEDYEYKIFPTCGMSGFSNQTLSFRDLPTAARWPGYIQSNDYYIHVPSTLHFTPAAVTLHGSDADHDTFVPFHNLIYALVNSVSSTDFGAVEPSSMIVPSINYDDWNMAGGSIVSSIYVMALVGSTVSCFNDSYDPVDIFPSNLNQAMDYSGSMFTAVIPANISRLRDCIRNESLLFTLLALSNNATRVNKDAPNISAITKWYDRNMNIHTVSYTLSASYDVFDATIYTPDFNNYSAMITPPARSITSIIAAASITAAVVTGIVITSKFLMRKMKYSRNLRRRAKTLQLSQEASSFDFTKEEIAELSPEDRQEYYYAWSQFNRKVDYFNKVGELFGNTTYDFRNDWVEVPAVSTFGYAGVVDNISNVIKDLVTGENNILTSMISGVGGRSVQGIDVKNITLADVYDVIVGGIPSATPSD